MRAGRGSLSIASGEKGYAGGAFVRGAARLRAAWASAYERARGLGWRGKARLGSGVRWPGLALGVGSGWSLALGAGGLLNLRV